MVEQRASIREMLSGEFLGITRERLDWSGYMQAYEFIGSTTTGKRGPLINELRQIILRDRDGGIVAGAMHLSFSLRLRELRGAIERVRGGSFRRFSPEVRKFVKRERDHYLLYMSKTE